MVSNYTIDKSVKYLEQSKEYLPLGVCDNYQYWGDDNTVIIKSGKGAVLTDLDNNDYVDFRMAYGPIILGYCDSRVDEAVVESISDGVLFGLSTTNETAVAKLIQDMNPQIEMVRYANSGTEAVMTALRLSRAYTGRDHFVMMEGAFHGLFDWVMWRSDVDTWKTRENTPGIQTFGSGIPEVLKEYIHVVPINDADYLRNVMRQYKDDIGTVLIEPIMGNCCGIASTSEYLNAVRDICDENDALLIFDEVKTGFRVANGGASELYGIKADLCTYAKAMANGYSISALGGRADIMSLFGSEEGGVVHGGTYTGNSIGLAAAKKTIEILKTENTLDELAQWGTSLKEQLSSVFKQYSVPHCFTGHASMFGIMFTDDKPSTYREWVNADSELYERWTAHAHAAGLMLEPDCREPWFICDAHKAVNVGDILEKVESSLKKALS